MSYKLPITTEKFLEASNPKKKKKNENELIMKDESGAEAVVGKPVSNQPLKEIIASSPQGAEKSPLNGEKAKSAEEQKLDYYLNLISRYEGKTIGDIAKEKYQSEYMSADTRSDADLEEIATDYANAHKAEKQASLTKKEEWHDCTIPLFALPFQNRSAEQVFLKSIRAFRSADRLIPWR